MDNYKSLLINESTIDEEMIEVSLDFWFNSKGEVRCPFPEYIKEDLVPRAVKKFIEWNAKISETARKEINDEILIEHFEEILFEEAHNMVAADDDKITIKYPFMLRIGDNVKHEGKPESKVISREVYTEKETTYLRVFFEELNSGEKWNTSFELFE